MYLICRKDAFEKVLSFIKELPCYKSDPVKCGSNVLDEKIVMAIENAVEDAKVSFIVFDFFLDGKIKNI